MEKTRSEEAGERALQSEKQAEERDPPTGKEHEGRREA